MKNVILAILLRSAKSSIYAKDIISGLIEYGYNELGLDEIYGIIFSDNIRSLNCVKQLGFEEYARDKGIFERYGTLIDDVYFKISKAKEL